MYYTDTTIDSITNLIGISIMEMQVDGYMHTHDSATIIMDTLALKGEGWGTCPCGNPSDVVILHNAFCFSCTKEAVKEVAKDMGIDTESPFYHMAWKEMTEQCTCHTPQPRDTGWYPGEEGPCTCTTCPTCA